MSFLKPLLFIFNNLFLVVAGLFGIGFIIGIHELGHFLFCKMFKVSTPSFSIGFGPRLISKKIGSTEFSLSAIPVGGYVEIAGAAEVGQGEQKEAYSTDQYSFARKPWYQKMLIMSGGILFNLLFAYMALALIFLTGVPDSRILYPLNATTTIEAVEPGSAADKAGLQKGDRITAVADKPIYQGSDPEQSAQAMRELVKTLANRPKLQPTSISFTRAGQERTVELMLDQREIMGKTLSSLGVLFESRQLPGFPLLAACAQGVRVANAFIINTIASFKHMFSSRDISQAGGPLMIISATAKSAGQGGKIFLLLLALISINLAILNLIPVPILDGGQMVFYSIEALVGRPLPIKVREYIHIASWLMFLVLILYLSAKDLYTIVTGR